MTTTLAGFAKSINPLTDIITAYSSAPYQPVPLLSPAPFVVIGSFQVPTQATGRLNVVGLVQGTSVCTVALYGPEQVVAVALASSQEQSVLSSVVTLQPGVTYQVAVKFEGADSAGIAVVRTVTLVP